MKRMKIAAVQLDFIPVSRTNNAGWFLKEPALFLRMPSGDELASLSSIKFDDPKIRKEFITYMQNNESEYIKMISEKLQDILSFCMKNEVDIVVLPEYSVPVAAVQVLRRFSNKMCIVAGIGFIRSEDILELEKLEIDLSALEEHNNGAIILSPKKNFCISKKNPADPENITIGSGSTISDINVNNIDVKLGISICLDFLNQSDVFFNDPGVKIIAIPALTQNTTKFKNTGADSNIKIFSNIATSGGTYISVPSLFGLSLANRNGTVPLSPNCEGIVIVDLDIDNIYKKKPTSQVKSTSYIYARSAIIYSGVHEDIAQIIQKRTKPYNEIMTDEDIVQFSEEIRTSLSSDSALKILEETLNAVDSSEISVMTQEDRNLILRHCVIGKNSLRIIEFQYSRLKILKKLFDKHLGTCGYLGHVYADYSILMNSITKSVRHEMLDNIQRLAKYDEKSIDSEFYQLVFYGRLGNFDDDAYKSFPRQLKMLCSIAMQTDTSLSLKYRLSMKYENSILFPTFEIICITKNRNQEEIDELRKGLGQLIHITFVGFYSIKYIDNDASLKNDSFIYKLDNNYEWLRKLHLVEEDSIFSGTADWGLIIDLLKSLQTESSIELQCIPGKSSSIMKNSIVIEREIEGSKIAANLYNQLSAGYNSNELALGLSIFIGAHEPIPKAIIDTIATELIGTKNFDILEPNPELGGDACCYMNPINVMRVFHPPISVGYRTSGRINKNPNRIKTDETKFSSSGIILGDAECRTIRSDIRIPVTITEKDRMRHLYVIGKTGSGKTNLLKKMAEQDVQIPNRGVTIIDPHGDLIDYVLRKIPNNRLSDVVLIDLARTDTLPVINPLSIDKTDITLRDRTIQELLSLLKTRIYHEHTGPRFDEYVRLALLTILDKGYPEPASLVEVPRILMDKNFHQKVDQFLVDKDTIFRWKNNATFERSNEYGETIQWVTSKFADIEKDSTLRIVLGGQKSTIDIEDIVNNGRILLVKIPNAVIGKQAADLIGSLILLQLRMAIIRRREKEAGKISQYHFVYIDEFQNFVTTDFETIISEARKFNIGFILANQNMEQLRRFSIYTGNMHSQLYNTLWGNVGNVITFNSGYLDAEEISKHLDVKPRDIKNIGRYEALAKILIDNSETKTFTLIPAEAVFVENSKNLEDIQNLMISKGIWLDPKPISEEIGNRIDNIISKCNKRDHEL